MRAGDEEMDGELPFWFELLVTRVIGSSRSISQLVPLITLVVCVRFLFDVCPFSMELLSTTSGQGLGFVYQDSCICYHFSRKFERMFPDL